MTLITAEQAERWGIFLAVAAAAASAKWDSIRAKRVAHETRNDVAERLAESEAKRDDSLKQIHALVNGAMGNVLHKVWMMAEELSQVKGTPGAADIASRAKEEYESHMARQQLVDAAAKEALKAFTDVQINARQRDAEGPISAT